MMKLYNNLNNQDPKIQQNPNFQIQLKQHQMTIIQAMITYEANPQIQFQLNGDVVNYQFRPEYDLYDHQQSKLYDVQIQNIYGILADKIGSGKTIDVIAFIMEQQVPLQKCKFLQSNGFSQMQLYNRQQLNIKTNLIIVPHNIILQWQEVIKLSNLNFVVIINMKQLQVIKKYVPEQFNELQVIIISETMFLQYEEYSNYIWARIFIDEVCVIKLPQQMIWSCNFIWLITATPLQLQHVKKQYIRVFVRNYNLEIINNIIIKNNDEYVDQCLQLFNMNHYNVNCLTPKQLSEFREFFDEQTLQNLNADNIQGAIIRLNNDEISKQSLIKILVTKIQKQLHNATKDYEYHQNYMYVNPQQKQLQIKKDEQLIKSLEIKLLSIQNKIKENNQCIICYEQQQEQLIISCCNSVICQECINHILTDNLIDNQQKCPYCRQNIGNKQYQIYVNQQQQQHLLTKQQAIIKIINKYPNKKFLLFSNYNETFENIDLFLKKHNITTSELKGSPFVIRNIINKFNDGQIQLLMLNAQHYGSGLNLQMSTDIIIFHKLDSDTLKQVIGRAQRLGRQQALNIFYLQYSTENNGDNKTIDIYNDDDSQLVF